MKKRMEARCVNVTDNRMRRQKFFANAPQVELEVVQIVRKGLDVPEEEEPDNEGALMMPDDRGRAAGSTVR